MKLFANVSRVIKTIVAAVVVASAVLVVPGGAAHAEGSPFDELPTCNPVLLHDHIPCKSRPTPPEETCWQKYSRGVLGVYLFSEVNYQGDCTRYELKPYAGNDLGDVGNDRASSMVVINVPSGIAITYYVSLYQDANMLGAMWTMGGTERLVGIPDFRNRTMTLGKNLNDRVSSIRITR